MNTYYSYKVTFYDAIENSKDSRIGVVCASSIVDAVSRIVSDYGEDFILSCSVSEIASEGDYCIEKEELYGEEYD